MATKTSRGAIVTQRDAKIARSMTAEIFGAKHVDRFHLGDWFAVIDDKTQIGPARTKRDAYLNAVEFLQLQGGQR